MAIQKMKSIREQVYEELKSLIIDAEIQPGEKIIEVEYAAKFGVSRTPIREALRMLEYEGLVNMSEKGGVTVNYISSQDIIEIYKIRIALEELVLSEILEKENIDLDEIKFVLSKTRKKIERDAEVYELLPLFNEFNMLMYKISNLRQVLKMITNLNEYTRRFRRMSLNDKERLIQAYKEHVLIIDAIEKKDRELAIEINRRHLTTSMNYALSGFSKEK